MERLAFGHGAVPGRREVPEVRIEPRVAHERDIPPVVADPLPGESSDWAFFGLLGFTAVLFFRPQDQVPALGSLHLAEVTALVGLGAMVAKRLARGLSLVRLTPEIVGLLAFGGALLFSTPFSFWPGGSVEVITGLYVKVLLIVVLMVNSINSAQRLRRFSWLIVFASSYLAARAVTDYIRGVNLIEHGRVAGSVHGMFGNPNDLALNMVAFLPLAALFALRPPRPRHAPLDAATPRTRASLWPWAAAAASLLMVLTVVFTKSRSGALGMAAMGAALVYFGHRVRPSLAPIALVVTVLAVPMLPSSFWARMTSIVEPAADDTGSREARRTVMWEATEVFLERPFTGIGPGQFKNYNPPGREERWREAHNVWLQVASETGLPGLLTFAFLVVAAFRDVLWARRRLARLPASGEGLAPLDRRDAPILHLHAAALIASLAGWFVCAFFASVAYNWTFYYLLGLCIATRELTRTIVASVPVRRRAAEASGLQPIAMARG